MAENKIDNAFSAEGTLFQVEYALEAAKKGVPVVIVSGSEGIAMAAHQGKPEKLMKQGRDTSSFIEICPGVFGAMSGQLMDAQRTAIKLRSIAVETMHDLGKFPGPDIVARKIADRWQIETQKNERRLVALNLSVFGHEKNEPLIYHTDSSGSLLPYKGVCFGEGGAVMMKKLEKIYRENTSRNETLQMALQALSEALGNNYLATSVEIAFLQPGQPLERITVDEVDSLLVHIAEASE